jgi:hypothetical protein
MRDATGAPALRWPGIAVLAFALFFGVAAQAGTATTPTQSCDENTVTLIVPDGPVPFTVEIMRTPEEQARGLMFRTDLAPRAGMLFVYASPRPASFWMKNTMISLDMVFIDDAGVVLNIAERTVPYSLAPRSSDGPVRAVLEIVGGTAEALGLGPGSIAVHPAFTAAEPPYLCPQAG